MSAPGSSPWPSGVLFGLTFDHNHGSSLRQDRQRVAHRAGSLPARISEIGDENPLCESVERPAVRHDQGRPPGREHHLLGRTMADIGWLIGVRLAQYDKISVAGVHAQHARDCRIERVVSPGLVGDAAPLCSLPKALESRLGLPLRLGIHGRLDVPRNVGAGCSAAGGSPRSDRRP